MLMVSAFKNQEWLTPMGNPLDLVYLRPSPLKKEPTYAYCDGWKVGKDVWRSKSFHSRKQLCDYAMETEKSLIVGNTSFGIAKCPILILLGGIGRYINDPDLHGRRM